MPTQDLPWIVLVSTARSGTTHLIRMMDGIKDLHVVKEEWFNETKVTWAQPQHLRAVSDVAGTEFTSHTDQGLFEWVRANKAQTLHLLQSDARPNDGAAMCKLFQHYVSDQEFRDLFLSNPNGGVLILKRRPIDSYISLCKANAIDKWVNKDTTKMKVELDAADFQKWHQTCADWFHFVETELTRAGRSWGRLDYDADIAQGDNHMLNRAVQELGRAGFDTRRKFGHLTEITLRKIGPKRFGGLHDPRLGARKQDKAKTPSDKVLNWKSFLEQIAEQPGGLARLDSFDCTTEKEISAAPPSAPATPAQKG